MASVAHLAASSSTSNGTTYTSGSFTPTEGDLLVVCVVASGTTDNIPTLDESAGGGTYTLVEALAWNGTASRTFHFVRDQLVGASPPSRTLTFTCELDAATGCSISVERVTGMSVAGLSAVVQSISKKDSVGTTPNLTFAAPIDSGNPVILSVAVNANPSGLTEPGSFSELIAPVYNNPATSIEVSKADSGISTDTLTWGTASPASWGAIGLELDAGGGGGTEVFGTAALSSSGSLSGAGSREVFGSSAPSGGGALAVAGTREVFAAAALSASDSLVATALREVFGSSALSASDALVAQGLRSVFALASLPVSDQLVVVGTITPGGANEVFGTAALDGGGALAVSGSREVFAVAGLSVSDALVVAGLREVFAQADLPVSDALVASAVREVFGAASLAEADALASVGLRSVLGAAQLQSLASLVASGSIPATVLAVAALSSSAQLRAVGKAGPPGFEVRGRAWSYSPRQRTATGFAWPMETTTGDIIFAVRQYVIQVPYERRIVDHHGDEWRVTDVGLVEPV